MRRFGVRVPAGVLNLINMLSFVSRLLLLVIVLIPFMDDSASVRNRMHNRMNGAQLYEAIITINNFMKPIHG